MKKLLVILSILGLLFLVGCSADTDDNEMDDQDENEMTQEETTSTETETATTETENSTEVEYTAAEVAKHNTAEDCWSIVDGNVYDLTAWVGQHPGGAGNIVKICGKDGSSAFSGQHGSNDQAKAQLETFLLAPLQ